jgi:hypothetical protein
MALLTFEDIKNEVLAHGFSAQNYSARVENWINEAQQKMYRKADLLESGNSQIFTTVLGQDRYDVEANFSRVESVHIRSDEPDTKLYPFENSADFDAEYRTPNGKPSRYFIFHSSVLNNTSIWLRPVPDAEYEILIRYKRLPLTLENPKDTPSIPIDYIYLLVEYCLYKAYLAEGDVEMSNTHKAIFDKDVVQFANDVQSSRIDGPTQVEGAWSGNE